MTTLKTRPNDQDVTEYISKIENPQTRQDSALILEIMLRVTGTEPVMWGDSIIGFGSYHYTYASGREGDWFLTGFSPRKQSLTLYIMAGFSGYDTLLSRLGVHKTGKSCLYINRIADIDTRILEELIRQSVEHISTTIK